MSIPNHLMRDRNWGPTLFLFMECPKLQTVFTARYFELEDGIIKTDALKRVSRPWSDSEKFMLKLALHCFNGSKVDLSDMDLLDTENKRLAFEALRMRYG